MPNVLRTDLHYSRRNISRDFLQIIDITKTISDWQSHSFKTGNGVFVAALLIDGAFRKTTLLIYPRTENKFDIRTRAGARLTSN